MGILGCLQKEHFDDRAATSDLLTKDGSTFAKATKMSEKCSRDVQTMFFPPVPIERAVRNLPVNPFRKQVLWKYPSLVNKDALYDKKEQRFRDPEEMLSTYKRDFGCESGDFELIRSPGQAPLPDYSPRRYPSLGYKPRNRSNISADMGAFYALPDGRWSLKTNRTPRTGDPLKPAATVMPVAQKIKLPKWKSEYQANINGLANYMREKKVLSRKFVKVHWIPTLPQN